MMMRHTAICIAALTLLLAPPTLAQQAVWRSTSSDPAQLSQELRVLYLSLYNGGSLPTRTVAMGDQPFAETVMRAEGVWPAAGFPVEIDAMICDLNPDICTRPQVAADLRDTRSGASHVGGFLPSPGQWRAHPGDTLTIPDLRFTGYTTLSRVPVPPGWTPEGLTTDPRLDCAKWGMSCVELVRKYNPTFARAPKDWMAGTATVPVARLEAVLPDLAIAPPEPPPEPVPHDFTDPAVLRPPPAPLPTGQMQLETLRDNLLPDNKVIRYSVESELYYTQQRKLFGLISHPYAAGRDLPAPARNPVTVVVIDRKPVASHCNFTETYVWDQDEMLILPPLPPVAGILPAGSPPPSCDALEITDDLGSDDHPIGIGGLIAAQPGRHGIIGLNPYAKLVYLGLEDEQARTLIDKLNLIPLEARVANISLGVDPENSTSREMREAMAALQPFVLFIAAAGNEHEDLAEDCEILPACETDLDNVMTVVGLNDSKDTPELWETTLSGTNYNPDFDIAAIATPVLTTASRNRIGWQGGTSLAAPQVAAAASLVFAAAEQGFIDRPDERIAPKIIRDRLVYTADFMPGYLDSVYSGRLNIDRAIDVTHVRVRLRDGQEFTGLLHRAPPRYTCLSESDPDGQGYSWWWVRRIIYHAGRNQWVIFRNTGPDATDGARFTDLQRSDWCSLGTTSEPYLTLQSDDGQLHRFQLTEIADYTSRLFN